MPSKFIKVRETCNGGYDVVINLEAIQSIEFHSKGAELRCVSLAYNLSTEDGERVLQAIGLGPAPEQTKEICLYCKEPLVGGPRCSHCGGN